MFEMDLFQKMEALDFEPVVVSTVMTETSIKDGGDQLAVFILEQLERQIGKVISETPEIFDGLSTGTISREEAKCALNEWGGNIEMAAKLCAKQRHDALTRMQSYAPFAEEDMLDALEKNSGDEYEAQSYLYKLLIQQQCAGWLVTDDSDEEDVGGQADMIRSPHVQLAHKCHILMAELGVCDVRKAKLMAELLTVSPQQDFLEVVDAAENCSDLPRALIYLKQECPTCLTDVPMPKMFSMVLCTHSLCIECAKEYFKMQIRGTDIKKLVCPVCQKPDMNDAETANNWLAQLDMTLLSQNIVDIETHALFQQKIRDKALAEDKNFRWCSKCAFGFIANPNVLKMMCPQCKQSTCFKCKNTWEDQHEGLTCERFQRWKEENDPKFQAEGIDEFLRKNGIQCPNCKEWFELAKGGCEHFVCKSCNHEFCRFCHGTFYRKDAVCGREDVHKKNEENPGFHGHHPRNCFYYLRDYAVDELLSLLQDCEVERDSAAGGDGCPVMVQNEAKKDQPCGEVLEMGCNGLCSNHFKEYLIILITKNKIDPLSMFSIQDIQQDLFRNGLDYIQRNEDEADEDFKERLIEIVREKVPLQ